MSENAYWNRVADRRLARRKFLAAAAVTGTGLVGLALMGCGDDDEKGSGAAGAASPTASTGGETPKKGGEVVHNTGRPSSQSLDPHTTLNRGFSYWGFIGSKMLSPHPKTLEPLQADLVEFWEQVDPLTLNLKVRQNVKWHASKITKGRALTAADIAYNLERIVGKYDANRVGQFQRAGTLVGLQSAMAIDDRTVQVKLSTPNSQFLYGMSDWRNWVVAKENVEADPNFANFGEAAGTGPFVISKWDPTQQIGEYTPNPDYYGKGPYLERIRQVSIPDDAASDSAFLSGKTHFISAQSEVARTTYKQDGVKFASWEHTGWEYFRMNQARDVFKDPRVRKALFLALDYQELMDSNYGEGYWDYTGPLPSGLPGAWSSSEVASMPGWNPKTKKDDIARAKEFMRQATGGDGEIEFAITPTPGAGPWYNNAVRIQAQLQKLWPKMKVNIVGDQDFAGFSRNLATGQYDAVTYGSFPPPSAVLEAGLHYDSKGSRNYTKYLNAEADRLVAKAVGEFDATSRSKLVRDLQKLLMDDIFIVPLGKRKGVAAYSSKIKGFDGWSGPGTYEAYDPVFSCAGQWFDPKA